MASATRSQGLTMLIIMMLLSSSCGIGNESSATTHFKNGIIFIDQGTLFNINTRVIVPVLFKSNPIENNYLNILNALEVIIEDLKAKNRTELTVFWTMYKH